MIISCPWIEERQKIEENLQKTMLSKEVLPHIVVVEDILKYMNLGLLELGHEFLRGGETMEKFIDLHMHSLYSDDGEFNPNTISRKML